MLDSIVWGTKSYDFSSLDIQAKDQLRFESKRNQVYLEMAIKNYACTCMCIYFVHQNTCVNLRNTTHFRYLSIKRVAVHLVQRRRMENVASICW